MSVLIDVKKSLPGFDLDIHLESKSRRLGILGASGSGKSLLLKCIAGLVTPDFGSLIIQERILFDDRLKINLRSNMRRIGFVFQNYALFPNLSIEDNIRFGINSLTRMEQDKKIAALIDKFHLKGLEKKYPSQISGGQSQRVALARALAVDPEVLILDEPFSALDDHLKETMIKEMHEYLNDFNGKTIYVTHQMEEAYLLCDHIAIIKEGCIDAYGPKEMIFKTPTTLESAKITGYKNITPFKTMGITDANISSTLDLLLPNWDIVLRTAQHSLEERHLFVGINPNDIQLGKSGSGINDFHVYVVDTIETPSKHILFVKFGEAPLNPRDFHLQFNVNLNASIETMGSIDPLHKVWVHIPPKCVQFLSE